nr:hypothetical protein [Tanacetum cinerariifolium]
KHKASYRFKIYNKRFSMNVEVFRDILNICPRILGQELYEPPTKEEALSFICELGHSEAIKYINDELNPQKSKKPKTKFDSTISSEETSSNKKATKAKKDLKEATKRSKKDFHISQASGSGDGTDFESGVSDEQQRKTSGADEETSTKPGVSDVPKYLSESENKSWGDSDDDESNDDNSNEVTTDDDEDDDMNVSSKVTRHEEVGKGDAKMTDTTHESASQENSYEQVIEDAHMILTSSQKTEGLKQNSYVSSNFASKFLNLDNVPPVIDKVASLMNVKTSHE